MENQNEKRPPYPGIYDWDKIEECKKECEEWEAKYGKPDNRPLWKRKRDAQKMQFI